MCVQRIPAPWGTPLDAGCNQRLSMDFVRDYLADRGALRMLNVVDAFTRECLEPREGPGEGRAWA